MSNRRDFESAAIAELEQTGSLELYAELLADKYPNAAAKIRGRHMAIGPRGARPETAERRAKNRRIKEQYDTMRVFGIPKAACLAALAEGWRADIRAIENIVNASKCRLE